MELKKILLPTDFSECAHAALDHAIFLAEQYGAELHLLHVVELHDEDPLNPAFHFPDGEEIYRRVKEISSSEMKDLLKAHSGRSLKVREHQRRAIAVAPEIVDFAGHEGMDLIVMGAHGRRGLRRFLLGSVTEEVVRTAPCPVLTIPYRDQRTRLERIETVVVPVDFSEPARFALATARELAAGYGARLHLVHVVEPPIYPQPYGPMGDAAPEYGFPQITVEVEKGLGRFLEETGGPEVETEIKVLDGHPAAAVTGYAERVGADLLVIATHGTTGLEHLLLGSVAEKIVRTSSTPVLTLKVPAES